MTDPATLLNQAKCYLCLGVTLAEALELALLAQIASGGGGGCTSCIVLGPWVIPQLPGWPGQGTPGQEVPLIWTNTTGKIQWIQFDIALSQQGIATCGCNVNINGAQQDHYNPQTAAADEVDFFFGTILAPGDIIRTTFDIVDGNTHRIQDVWYRTMN